MSGDLFFPGADGDAAPDDAQRVAIAPADVLTLFRAHLSGLAPAQARAAATILAAGRSVTPIDSLHIAIGAEDQSGMRWVAVCARTVMDGWLLEHDPASIIPAALLLPEPETGYNHAKIGNQAVLRGRDRAFADDPVLTPLLVGEEPVAWLDGDALFQQKLESRHEFMDTQGPVCGHPDGTGCHERTIGTGR